MKMLRITIHESSNTWRLQLEGKLAGAWVLEAENAWHSAPAGKPVEIDLTDVLGVDEAGRQLLNTMNRAGARFITEGIAMKTVVREMHSKNKGHHLVYALALLIAAHTLPLHAQDSAAAPMRLTLKEAVALSLRQNPQVAISNLNLIESQENRNLARSTLLPQASFSASDKVTRGNVETLFGKRVPGFPGHVGPFWAIQAGPQLSAPLFDLTLWNRWRAARETVGTSAAQQTTARELNAQLVVSQYLGSLRASADVTAAKSRLDLAKALLDLATDLQKSGVSTGIDALRANVQYQNERQRYTEATSQLKISLYGLSRLLNLNPQQEIELTDAPSFFETPAFDSGESLVVAYGRRPEMKTVLSQIRAAEFQKRAAKDERLPRLSVSGGWSLQGLTPSTMIPAYEYGASVDVPLFTGGRIKAQTAIADIELKKLAQSEQEILNQIALEVKTATAQLESARTEVEAANLGLSLAKESVTQAQDRFRAGVANNIEVITAQDELSRANDNQIAALYRYNQSRADLARATGRMEELYAQ
jgi:outer membrane protein TolC